MNDSARGVPRGWTAGVIFLIGISSFLLLLWVARLSERQRGDFLLVDALCDLHLHVTTFHVRLEEYLDGDVAAGPARAWKQWDQATRVLGAILSGGRDEHEQLLLPLRDGEGRTRALRVKSALAALGETATERLRFSQTARTDAAISRRFDDEFQAIDRDLSGLEELLEAGVLHSYLSSRRLIKAVGVVWLLIVAVSTAALFSSEKRRIRSEEQLRVAHDKVLAHSEDLARHEQHLAEMVEERTAELSRANERLQAENLERRSAESALRETELQVRLLSTRLLQAQEFERRRIAMELHDELGQALNVVKLQIRILERGLGEERVAAKAECEKLLDYVDQVIEDVRRLSLNLSPTVLEELGLTSALHWLISGIAQNLPLQVTADLAPIDHLFPAHARIVIYRVIQEALNNIVKHARAGHVAVVIRRQEDQVAFRVEDDGVGFDVAQKMGNNHVENGFGLTTMHERVRMIGGRLELWSQRGKGTRIAFSIPLAAGGP